MYAKGVDVLKARIFVQPFCKNESKFKNQWKYVSEKVGGLTNLVRDVDFKLQIDLHSLNRNTKLYF